MRWRPYGAGRNAGWLYPLACRLRSLQMTIAKWNDRMIKTCRMILFFIVLTAAGGISGNASAQNLANRNKNIDLMRDCQGRGKNYDIASNNKLSDPDVFGYFDIATCAAYLSGLSDLNALYRGLFGKSFFCFPSEGISIEQQILIFIKWAQDNPNLLHESKRTGVTAAFQQAFPCTYRNP